MEDDELRQHLDTAERALTNLDGEGGGFVYTGAGEAFESAVAAARQAVNAARALVGLR